MSVVSRFKAWPRFSVTEVILCCFITTLYVCIYVCMSVYNNIVCVYVSLFVSSSVYVY